MGKNKMDAINFCRLLDMFGEEAAKDALEDVNSGKVSNELFDKYLYDSNETKEDYIRKLREE